MIDVSVIIVNYNVKEYLQNLLLSLEHASNNLKLEIIVVDNNSDDGSPEIIQQKFPSVKFILNKKNVGFGAANNQAMQIAEGKYFLLINPDTIVKEDTIDKMFHLMENNPQIGLAGCKVLNPDGSLQLPCRRSFPGPWTSFTKVSGLSTMFPKSKLFARYNLTFLDENKSYEVDAVSGSFMFFKKEVFTKIGGFDPVFFMYGEDLDLCFRVQAEGYQVYFFHETEIIHYKGESTKRSNLDETRIFYDAMKLFVNKHFSTSIITKSLLSIAITLRKLLTYFRVNSLILIPAIIDFILFSSSMFLASKIYTPANWRGFPPEIVPQIFFLPAIFQVLVSAFWGVYKKREISVLKFVSAVLIGVIILASFTFFFKQFAYSRAVLLITYALFTVTSFSWRTMLKLFFKVGASEISTQRTLIVGESKKAIELHSKIIQSTNDIHHIVGFIAKTRINIGELLNGVPILGSLDNINKVIEEKKIDKIIFTPGEIDFTTIFFIVANSSRLNVDFMIAGDDQNFLVGKSSINLLNEVPLVKVHYNISELSQKIIKRFFDFVISIIVLVFVFPFLFLINLVKPKENNLYSIVRKTPEVLLGRKSFVGPEKSSYLGELFLGKIGLTGLWFTESLNKESSKEIDKINIYYARNQNIWFDIEILSKTLMKILLKSER
ncbi:MAG: glycosyltransferase [Melioribacteraceae bacterium]|nr:glycosyltransferase [Melioribacteraceae bacterium]MCF8431719.1 glycosyltransferase [Melioribacteraceae bacterium]